MRIAGTGLSTVLVLSICLTAIPNARAQTDGSATSLGRNVFESKGCIQCHAVFGDGGKVGPDLGEQMFYGSYLDLAGLMWNHFPRMYAAMQEKRLSQVQLTSEEMSQLVAYLLYMRYLGEPGKEFRGRKLLRDKKCLSCHKVGKVGGNQGPDFSTIEAYMSPLHLAESMWNHGPTMLQLSKARKVSWPRISAEEIVDIAAGIRSYMAPSRVTPGSFSFGNPTRGHELLEQKGCLSCHSVGGKGGDVGPDFAELDFHYSVTELAGRMWNHGPRMWTSMQESGMPSPTFGKGELADVVSALYDIRLNVVSGAADRGRAVLEERNCLSCHSLHGQGTGVAPDLAAIKGLDSPLEMVTAMWNHAPKMQEMVVSNKLSWPVFKEDEMASLYAYLRTQRQPAEAASVTP